MQVAQSTALRLDVYKRQLYVSSSLSLSVRASVVTADAETLKVKGLFDVL